jgi:hypothetical protein
LHGSRCTKSGSRAIRLRRIASEFFDTSYQCELLCGSKNSPQWFYGNKSGEFCGIKTALHTKNNPQNSEANRLLRFARLRRFARPRRFARLPVYQERLSVYQERLPVYQEKLPVYQEKLPVYQERLPVYQEKLPVYQERLPVYQERLPVYQEKLPVYQEKLPCNPAEPDC